MRHFEPIDAAHVTGGAGWHEHIASRQCAGIGVQAQKVPLGGKHDAVLRLVVDLQLRVVGAHMALAACGGQSGKGDRTGVARVALGATANGAIVVRLADGMALLATGGYGGMTFKQCERIRRTIDSAGLVGFAEGNLLRGKPLRTMDRCPTGSGVATAQKLLINAFMAGTAVAGSQAIADDKAVVIYLLLVRPRLVAIQTGHAFFCMGRHFVLMYHRILQASVTLRALTRCADKVRRRLLNFDLGASVIDKECSKNKRKRTYDSNEH